MIKLAGPSFAESGTEVCIVATNVGRGFSAVVTKGEVELAARIEFDAKKNTATICYTMVGSKGGVTVSVSSGSGGRGASHTTLAL